MLRAALTALAFAALAADATAQSTGVPVCDDFLGKYESCLNTKIPEFERKLHKSIIDELRRSTNETMKRLQDPSFAESTCRIAAREFNRLVQPYGCSLGGAEGK